MTREDGMLRLQGVELQVAKSIVMNQRHIEIGKLLRLRLRINLIDRSEFLDEELARLIERFFHVRIRKPGCCKPEQQTCKHAQERSAFTIRKDRRQERPIHLAEQL